MNQSSFYQVGGTLPPEAVSYITRESDQKLLNYLQKGEFCYVLNSRQMGKSSLMVQVMNTLISQGFACTAIDLSIIGNKDISLEKWCEGIIYTLATNFRVFTPRELKQWRQSYQTIPAIQRINIFLTEVLLVKITQKIIILIDEIDTVLSLPFSVDDFFALIRACYNQRSVNSEFERLTFALFGVANPGELISDKQRTPFNIGRGIFLEGFTLEEALPLANGLANLGDGKKILQAILAQTGGQPFLTQKICHLLSSNCSSIIPGTEEIIINNLVKQKVIQNWEKQDQPNHIATIKERLLYQDNNTGILLGLYQKILQNQEIIADDSWEQIQLQLTGLVVKKYKNSLKQNKSVLQVYNPIYKEIFNYDWVSNLLDKVKPYNEALTAWLDSNCQDDSRLLTGKALKAAQIWSKDKTLSNIDYKFLTASQQLEKTKLAQKLAAEQKARKKDKIYLNTSIFFIVTLCFSIGIIFRQNRLINTANKSITIDRQGYEANTNFLLGSEEINSLLLAMQAGFSLNKFSSKNELSSYPTLTPLFALNSILENIHQKNKFVVTTKNIKQLNLNSEANYISFLTDNQELVLTDLLGKFPKKIKLQENKISLFKISKNGSYILTLNQNSKLSIWQKKASSLIHVRNINNKIKHFAVSKNNSYIATIDYRNICSIWTITGKRINSFYLGKNQIIDLDFGQNSRSLIIINQAGIVKSKDFFGKTLRQFNLELDKYSLINFSADKSQIVTVDANSKIKIWQVTGKKIAEFKIDQAITYSVDFTVDNQYIITTSEKGEIQLWNYQGKLIDHLFLPEKKINHISVGEEVIIHSSVQNSSQVFYPLAVNTINNKIEIIYLRAKKQFPRLISNLLPDNELSLVSFSNNLQNFATLTNKTIDIYQNSKLTQTKPIFGINAMDFQAKNGLLALVKYYGEINILDTKNNLKIITKFKNKIGSIWSIKFSPSGKLIATGDSRGLLQIWDNMGNLLKEIQSHKGGITTLNFTADGKKIITAGEDGKLRLWLVSGNLLQEWETSQTEIKHIAIDWEKEMIVTASENGEVELRVFSLAGWQHLIAKFTPHFAQIEIVGLKFFTNTKGNYIVTIGSDNTLNYWQIYNLQQRLKQSCNWLKDYLANNSKKTEKLLKNCTNLDY